MISGMNMATLHVVGFVALLKAKNMFWNLATLVSTMMTIVDIFDCNGKPFRAQ
jgi:hypothetical protein